MCNLNGLQARSLFPFFHLQLWESFISRGCIPHSLFVSKDFIAFPESFHYFLGLKLQAIWLAVLKKENSE